MLHTKHICFVLMEHGLQNFIAVLNVGQQASTGRRVA